LEFSTVDCGFFYVTKQEEIDNIIEAMAFRFNWTPFDAERFFLDEKDSFGIFYWRDLFIEQDKKSKSKK